MQLVRYYILIMNDINKNRLLTGIVTAIHAILNDDDKVLATANSTDHTLFNIPISDCCCSHHGHLWERIHNNRTCMFDSSVRPIFFSKLEYYSAYQDTGSILLGNACDRL